tara:strand:+ start:31799 stop:31993 length:195 start_codon:yes stop_codon:yes gene_type:complete
MIDWVEVGPFIVVGIAGLIIGTINYRRYKVGDIRKFRREKSNEYFDTRYGKKRYTNAVRHDPRG